MHPRAWASSTLGVGTIHVGGDDGTNGQAMTGVGLGKYPDASNGPSRAFGTAIERNLFKPRPSLCMLESIDLLELSDFSTIIV